MKILKATWFTTANGELVGIVMGTDDVTGERKAYVGIGDGANEATDMQRIAETGGKLTPSVAQEVSDYFLKGT